MDYLSVRLDFQLSNAEALKLAGVAYSYGYMREEPRKPWSSKELKEAARYAAEAMVRERLGL
jgi:hypothetical protein